MNDEITPGKATRPGLYVTSDPPSEFAAGSAAHKPALMHDFISWSQRAGLGRRIGIALMVAAVAAGADEVAAAGAGGDVFRIG